MHPLSACQRLAPLPKRRPQQHRHRIPLGRAPRPPPGRRGCSPPPEARCISRRCIRLSREVAAVTGGDACPPPSSSPRWWQWQRLRPQQRRRRRRRRQRACGVSQRPPAERRRPQRLCPFRGSRQVAVGRLCRLPPAAVGRATPHGQLPRHTCRRLRGCLRRRRCGRFCCAVFAASHPSKSPFLTPFRQPRRRRQSLVPPTAAAVVATDAPPLPPPPPQRGRPPSHGGSICGGLCRAASTAAAAAAAALVGAGGADKPPAATASPDCSLHARASRRRRGSCITPHLRWPTCALRRWRQRRRRRRWGGELGCARPPCRRCCGHRRGMRDRPPRCWPPLRCGCRPSSTASTRGSADGAGGGPRRRGRRGWRGGGGRLVVGVARSGVARRSMWRRTAAGRSARSTRSARGTAAAARRRWDAHQGSLTGIAGPSGGAQFRRRCLRQLLHRV